jgi:putative peptidoglycan lipid II flippase
VKKPKSSTVEGLRPPTPPRRDSARSALRAPRSSIVRTTLVVLPAQIVFRGIEALLPFLLATWFGATLATDVYNFVFMVFSLAGSLVFGLYQDSALVPILAEERLARRDGMPRLLGSLLTHTWIVGGALAATVGLVALVAFFIAFSGADLALAVKMVAPFALFLVAMSTRTFFGTLLASEHRYLVQPVASCLGMLANIGILATWHARTGIALVPVAALAGEIVASGVLAWYAIAGIGTKIRLCLDRPEALVKFAKLVSAEVGGGAVTRVNPVVDQFMAGLALIVGGGTMLRYSGDVATLPTSLLQAALLPVLLSHLSDDFAAKRWPEVRRTVVRALAAVMAILVAAAVILYFVRVDLLRFVFLRGEMREESVDLMIRIFPYHLVGLAPFGALLVLARAHVALKNSGIMLQMGILNAACNAVFNVVLLKAIGIEGIALSTSCVQAAVALVFWFRLERRMRVLEGGGT